MEKIEIGLEDEKKFDCEAKLEQKKHKSELVFRDFAQPIAGIKIIDDLVKRVKIYFRFTPKKLMFSHKGRVYISNQTDWFETQTDGYETLTDCSETKKELSEEEIESFFKRQKNNEDFIHSYLEAISGKRKKPLRIKVFEDEEAKCDDDFCREDFYGCPIKKSKQLSKEETKKIKFTYLDQVVEDLKINFDEIKDFEGIIKFLNNKLIEKFLKDLEKYGHLLNDK